MKINKGVEWAAHAAALLGALPDRHVLSAEALADYFELPPAYLAKQLQSLSQAKLVLSLRGANGGYRLAKPATDISLLDIALAVDGPAPAFKCTEIRQSGPCGAARGECKTPCGIAASFYAAEEAFRSVLADISVADMIISGATDAKPERVQRIAQWISAHAIERSSG